jgi:hypothetical protein
MKLSSPKMTTWWVAVVLGALGFLGMIIEIAVLSDYAGWLAFAGFALLAIATMTKGL